MLWKVIACWSSYEYKDVTRRSRERAKWQKEGRIRWGGGTEWRSKVTSRPRVHGLRCQWLKRTWKKKKQPTLKGIVMKFCWIGVMQNFSHISPWHLQYNLYFSWLYCRVESILGCPVFHLWGGCGVKTVAVESIPVFWVMVCVCACVFVVKWDQLIHMIFKIAL